MDTEHAPTRAAVLELKEERTVVTEAYDFLDEKRLLLAAEMLRQLEQYERLFAQIQSLYQEAGDQLAAAVQLHGLQGVTVYPAVTLGEVELGVQQRNFMGIRLVDIALHIPGSREIAAVPATNSSVEAERCRAVFYQILQQSAVLSGISGNLYRLLKEFRLTERRTRALENIILPEIEQALVQMSGYLEELDLEDAIRARLHEPSA